MTRHPRSIRRPGRGEPLHRTRTAAALSTFAAACVLGIAGAPAPAQAADQPATVTKVEPATSIDRNGHQNIELINGSSVKQTVRLHESLTADSVRIATHSAVTVHPKGSGIITVKLTPEARKMLSKTGAELEVTLIAVCTSAGHRSTTVTKHVTLRRAI